MPKKTAPAKKASQPSYSYLIEKKRDGGEFSEEEVRLIVDNILDKNMPESQIAGLCMAIYFQGMSAHESAYLAEEMMLSGEVIDFSRLSKPKIDKYSTGGVGDKTAMVLAPLAASASVVMPSMHGVDESYMISTLDKLSSIPGFEPNIPMKTFVEQVKKLNCAIAYQSPEIAPVDNYLYDLRAQTGTIPSLPLITSSVLARKLAQGAEVLVADIKWGNGSFIKDVEQARQLARSITRVARGMNRRAVGIVTDMNQPLGNTVGSSLEVQEAIELLKGEGPEDLKELVLKLGMEIVRLSGVAGSTLSAKQTVEHHLHEGKALDKFKQMVAAQGGKTEYIDNPDKFTKAKYVRKLPAPKRGYVHTINAGMIENGVHQLAMKKGGKLESAVGVSEIKKVGTQVKQGEPLMMIHYNDEAKLEQTLDYFKNAFRLAPKRPNLPDLIVERVA